MLKALSEGAGSLDKHLKECEACRLQTELLAAFPEARETAMERPSPDAVNRYTLVPLLFHDQAPSQQFIGDLTYDSWASQPRAALRSTGPGLIRRLCLKAGDISLEIVAERQQAEWTFTARVYAAKDVSSKWVLQVSGKRMLPGSLGFYHWNSKRTPQRIELKSIDEQIEFADLVW